jgi:hypothetical protein
LILEHLIIWLKIKLFFLLLMNVTPNKYLLVMIDLFLRWMLNLLSYMGICKKKSIWSNLLAMFKMTPSLFVALRNLFMVLSKLLELGMPKLTTFFLTLVFLDVILTRMFIPRKKEAIS